MACWVVWGEWRVGWCGVLGGVACWVVLGEWRVGCGVLGEWRVGCGVLGGVACMLQCMCWVSGVLVWGE